MRRDDRYTIVITDFMPWMDATLLLMVGMAGLVCLNRLRGPFPRRFVDNRPINASAGCPSRERGDT